MSDDSQAPLLRSVPAVKNKEKIDDINQQFKERDIRKTAKQTGMRYIDLKNAPVDADSIRLMTWEEVKAAQMVPFHIVGNVLQVACTDPESGSFQKKVKSLQDKGYEVETFVCSPEGIASTKRLFENFKSKEEVPIKTEIEETGNVQTWNPEKDSLKVFKSGTGPEMINTLNLQAIKSRASDIHFQPEENRVVVRMRRDGILSQVLELNKQQYLLLSGEIKRSSGLKINVRKTPQDGEYQFTVNKRKVGVRVSTLPSRYGESIVLRMLDAQRSMVDIKSLGFSENQMEMILRKLDQDSGLILVTGPTGSGKTSTLYSYLNILNKPENKIITLEDPIEYEIPNVSQSEISEEDGYTFASGLRASLRQDPDILMVGEIRDKETAEIALQASLTGHLVLSTIHSNDAILTIPRLLNIGVTPYILALGLEMIIAQRLVRRLCEFCRKPVQFSEQEQKEIEADIHSLEEKGISITKREVYTAEGCEKCSGEGYQGRMVIAEVLQLSDIIRKAILGEESAESILEKSIKEGYITIKEDGIMKVLNGLTSLEEVWKVLL